VIKNNGKAFRPEILAKRVPFELMKDLPSKAEGSQTPGILFN
jgi:hypothetical protein